MKHRWNPEPQKTTNWEMYELLWVFSDETILTMLKDLKKMRPSPGWRKDYENLLLHVTNEVEARGL